MTGRGWQADPCLIQPDGTAAADVERMLSAQAYDCVVIGGGVRIPPRSLLMFEAVVNAAHRAAPGAVIAFNTRPRGDTPTPRPACCRPAEAERT